MDYKEKLEKAKVNMDYKERLERAKELYPTANADQRYVLESLFPELAESEDERIRKELINWLQNTEGQVLPIDRYNAALAWLEKQGETYTKRDVDDAYVAGMAFAKDELEKQGEPKEYTFKSIPRLLDMIEPSDRAKAYCQKLIGSLVREGYATDAKIVAESLRKMNGEDVPMAVMDEQKATNKVEPKFKIGDWIISKDRGVHEDYRICRIYRVDNDRYYIENGDFLDKRTVCDYEYKLWTIQDAEDGDVLYCKGENEIEYLVINKGINKCGNIDSYFRYNSLNDFGVDIPSVLSIKYDNITPATKEQRDTLFQKMKEAGYEWNAELKKVSKITTPADVGFAELSKAWAEEANKQNLANSAKTCKKSQRMISAEAKEALYDKPAWSEEEEVKIN